MATFGNKKVPTPRLGVYGLKGVIDLFLEMTIGASGAITTSTANIGAAAGMTIAKTASKTGRYTLTLPSAFKHFLEGVATLIGPTDAIWGANTVGGPDYFFRNNNIDRGTKAGTIDLQFSQNGSNADAELPSGTIVIVHLTVGQGG